jgi:hypothetical protein
MMRFGKAIVEVTEAVAEDQNVVPSSSIQIESFGAEHIALRKKRPDPIPHHLPLSTFEAAGIQGVLIVII